MDLNAKILGRLDEPVCEAEGILNTSVGSTFDDVDAALVWKISCLPLLKAVASEDSRYYTEFEKQNVLGWSKSLQTATAILKRVRADYARGYIPNVRELAAAEVFTDFLDMAEHLHSGGYHVPAASVAGAVLEDSLRRLHLKHIGQVQGMSSISKLNDALRKADIYGQAAWRQIQVWGDIRNDADHGHFEKVEAAAVKQMISGIRDFIAKHEG